MARGILWRLVPLSLLTISSGVALLTQQEGRFLSSRMSGVARTAPVQSASVTSKVACAKACTQLPACQSFSMRSESRVCQLFSRRIMQLDLQASSLDAHFARFWLSCPAREGYVTVPGTSKCIRVSNVSMTWEQAADTCGKEGGHLLIVDNSGVLQRLQGFIPDDWYWVGFNDLDTEDKLLWQDGTAVNRSLFYGAEPSDARTTENEDCGLVKVELAQNGLHDGPCYWNLKFLCSLPVRPL